jgi:hypothetical protein
VRILEFFATLAVPRLKLALIGFVFPEPEGGFIFIILCDKDICVHPGFSEIGFVLHN